MTGQVHAFLERFKEISRSNIQSLGQPNDNVQGGISPAALDSTHVSAIQPDMQCKGLLGPSALPTEVAHSLPEGETMRSGYHLSTVSAC